MFACGRKIGQEMGMRSRAPLIALILLILPFSAIAQTYSVKPITGDIALASGETVSYVGAVSYNKLRRGTKMEMSYQIFIRPEACFLFAHDAASGRRGVRLELVASPGLLTTVIKQSGGKAALVNHVKVPNCSYTVQFRARIMAPLAQPLGMQRVTGQITWQAVNPTGALPPQTTRFEFPIEVVEHGDRTAKYNEYYGYRPKLDLLWRVPTLPFVLIYCAAKGNADCPD